VYDGGKMELLKNNHKFQIFKLKEQLISPDFFFTNLSYFPKHSLFYKQPFFWKKKTAEI